LQYRGLKILKIIRTSEGEIQRTPNGMIKEIWSNDKRNMVKSRQEDQNQRSEAEK